MRYRSKATEHDEQVAVIQWAKLMAAAYPELELLYAIPNGAKVAHRTNKNGVRYSPEGQRLVAEGLKRGVPDLCLPVARQGYHALYIEMKRPGGDDPREDQIWWLDHLAAQGNLAIACFGFDEARQAIGEYLGIKGL